MKMGLLLSDNIRNTLRLLNITSRPSAGPGTWLLFLLPLAVILSDLRTSSSDMYHLLAVLCRTLIGSATIFLLHIYWCHEDPLVNMNKSMFILAAFTSLRLYAFYERGFLFSVFSSCLSSFGFSCGTLALLKACPQCFTFGEASLITQSIILFLFSTAENIYSAWNDTPFLSLDIATIILQVGLLGIAAICGITYFVPTSRTTVPFYSVMAAVLLLGVIPLLHVLLNGSPVFWILQLLISDTRTVWLVIYWMICCGIAVVAVAHQIKGQQQASTVVRKYFHILAVAVYIPGLINACCLLYLATGIVLAAFIMLELLRVLHIPPLGTVLQEGFTVYADEKDAGNLALTPIYLLAGCSLPVWLHPLACPSSVCFLPLLSGLLAIGVGDTLASVVGTWIGHHKWPGSKKTIEGTLACIIGQIMVICILVSLRLLDDSPYSMMKTGVSIIVTSLVEANTDQVDNLVLPLITYIILM